MSNSTETAKKGTSKDVATIITERIIEQLEKGTVPWRKPWYDSGIPTNLISHKPYRGMNVMLLAMLGYEQNYFITQKQLQAIGGSLKQNEKPNMVVFWNYGDKKNESAVNETESTDETENKKAILRYYMVYNVSQCTGIDAKIPTDIKREIQPILTCESIVAGMPNPPAIKHKEARAYYSPTNDLVNMPKQSTFESNESYYSILFHELVHSTGHHSRLDRMGLIQMPELGSKKHAYSFEELIAEIGACYLQCHAGINDRFEQSASYIQGWLGVLKNDKRFIISAATSAQKATDYILNIQTDIADKQQVLE